MRCTLQEYRKRLESHDWFHYMSDCHYVWKHGQEAEQALQVLSHQSAEHRALWLEFLDKRRAILAQAGQR